MYIYSSPKRYPAESMTVRRTLCVSVGQLHQTKHTHAHSRTRIRVNTYYMDVCMRTLHTARTTELGRRRRV